MKIKILSYNIHKGRSFFLRHRTWFVLEKLMNEVEPDIVFLQEFLVEPQAEKLLERFADKMWPHYSFGQNATTGNFQYGNAILSKYPFVETHSTDISTNTLEKRGVLYGKITIENKDIFLFCSHLDLTHKGRAFQIQKISQVTAALTTADDRVIIAADFNDWNNTLHSEIQRKVSCAEVSEAVYGFLKPTSPSIFPKFSLDRVYFRNLKPLSTVVLSSKFLRIQSDHLPIVCEFEI